MPTHRELRNLTQCLYYATAKANSVTAFVGIMYYWVLYVLTRAHKPGSRASLWLKTQLLDSTDMSEVCVVFWLRWFSQIMKSQEVASFIALMSRETANTAMTCSSYFELSNSFPKLQSWMFSIPLYRLLPTPSGFHTGSRRSWSLPTFLLPNNARCPVKSPQCEYCVSGLKYLKLEVSTHLVNQSTL